MEGLNCCNEMNEILPLIISKVFIFQLFKVLDSTCFRVHQRLQNICKAPAISSQHDLNSIGKGSLYFYPLHIIDRIFK